MTTEIQLFLIDLATKINQAHEQCEQAFRASLLAAKTAGEYLIQAKAQVPHGGWLDWVNENCRFKRTQANSYMRIAARWEELSADPNYQATGNLSIQDALTLLSRSTDEDQAVSAQLTIESAIEIPASEARGLESVGDLLPIYKPACDEETIEQGLREGWIQPVSRLTEPEPYQPAPTTSTSSTVEVEVEPKPETKDRVEHDYYPTPNWCVEALLKNVGIDGQIFEPCVGNGAIADRFYGAVTNDLHPHPDHQPDYSEDASNPDLWTLVEAEGGIDWVVTNPPYAGDAPIEILKLAYETARIGVAFLLRLSFLEPCDNRAVWLQEHADNLTDMIVLNPRPRFRTEAGGDNVTSVWLVWRKQVPALTNTRVLFVRRETAPF